MTFTGLKDFLESKKPNEQVKKSEIEDFIRDNRIEVVEVVKGTYSKEVNDLFKRLEEKNKWRNFSDWDGKDLLS